MKYTKEQINEYRARWLAQLRSPHAKKGRCELETPEVQVRRCCLGHACHALNIRRHTNIMVGTRLTSKTVLYDNESSVLPESAAVKLNITPSGLLRTPVKVKNNFGEYFHVNSLTKLNDNTPLFPSEIADFIEEQFENNNLREYQDYAGYCDDSIHLP